MLCELVPATEDEKQSIANTDGITFPEESWVTPCPGLTILPGQDVAAAVTIPPENNAIPVSTDVPHLRRRRLLFGLAIADNTECSIASTDRCTSSSLSRSIEFTFSPPFLSLIPGRCAFQPGSCPLEPFAYSAFSEVQNSGCLGIAEAADQTQLAYFLIHDRELC